MRSADTPVVGLVCSAGGLDALRRVLRRLPADFGAAVIVAQHQAPHGAALLAAILARACALPVHTARPGERLRPGVVAVVPPGKHALVTNEGTIALVIAGATPPARPSADLLLTSMALSLGPRAIGVVLSGGGHDGATGATAVHDFGGVVIASDRPSSEHFSMPNATITRDEAVDFVLPVDEIGAFLAERVPPRRAAGNER